MLCEIEPFYPLLKKVINNIANYLKSSIAMSGCQIFLIFFLHEIDFIITSYYQIHEPLIGYRSAIRIYI